MVNLEFTATQRVMLGSVNYGEGPEACPVPGVTHNSPGLDAWGMCQSADRRGWLWLLLCSRFKPLKTMNPVNPEGNSHPRLCSVVTPGHVADMKCGTRTLLCG